MYTNYHNYYDTGTVSMPTFNGQTQNYWERSLFQRLTCLFEFKNLPDGWDKDAFKYGLYRRGFLAVFESKKYGRVFQPATPAFMGLYYQPTGMQVTSPFFNFQRPLRIGEECEVIKLTPDYRGLWSIISKYASELTLQEVAIRQSQRNARFAYAAIADNENAARSLKSVFQKLGNAEDAIVVDSKLAKRTPSGEVVNPWTLFDRDLKSNFILPELIDGRRQILTDFFREIGIRVAPEKKERIGELEAYSYDAETLSRLMVYNDTLQESLERVNKFLNSNIVAVVQTPGTRGGMKNDSELIS